MLKIIINKIKKLFELEEKIVLRRKEIPVNRLRVGVFIELDEDLAHNPLRKKSLKITSKTDIIKLKKYKIDKVWVIPAKCEEYPYTEEEYRILLEKRRKLRAENEITEEEPKDEQTEENTGIQFPSEEVRKQQQIEHTRRVNQCEKKYKKTVGKVKDIMNSFRAHPAESVQEVTEMIDETVSYLLAQTDITINVMNEQNQDGNAYFHHMNVFTLSLLLGKAFGLGGDELKVLGIGALFHDVGKEEIPGPIKNKTSELTKSEQKIYALHTTKGEGILKKAKNFPKEAIKIVLQHHEKLDGSGYPNQLKRDEINVLAQIVAIVNIYDNHCNNKDISKILTPAEALKKMFNYQKAEMDEDLLEIFIKCLGVYPPATIVQLSDGSYGMVLSVDSETGDSSFPKIVLYNKEFSKEAPYIHDMAKDKRIKIEKAIRPLDLPKAVFEYLNPRKVINYSIDTPNSDNK